MDSWVDGQNVSDTGASESASHLKFQRVTGGNLIQKTTDCSGVKDRYPGKFLCIVFCVTGNVLED